MILGDILYNALDAGVKLNQLAEHDLFQTKAVHDTVMDRDNGAALVDLELDLKIGDLFLDHRNDIRIALFGRGSAGKIALQAL